MCGRGSLLREGRFGVGRGGLLREGAVWFGRGGLLRKEADWFERGWVVALRIGLLWKGAGGFWGGLGRMKSAVYAGGVLCYYDSGCEGGGKVYRVFQGMNFENMF